MDMAHWLHRLAGCGRLLAAYVAGELPPAERARAESRLRDCPTCRREAAAYRLAIGTLRQAPAVTLTADEAARFWPDVARRIAHGEDAKARRPRPGLREMLWDHPRLSLASAATAAVFLAAVTLGQLGLWGAWTTGPNGVEVISVDVEEDASVMVFELPGSLLKVIWVLEAPEAPPASS
jgi:anti-sigma factor RsiW